MSATPWEGYRQICRPRAGDERAGRIAIYDATDKVFARAPELLELGLSVPEVTKIFLRLREMGLDIDTDVYTVKYAVKTILAARAAAKEGM